jgi:hypothetical protein
MRALQGQFAATPLRPSRQCSIRRVAEACDAASTRPGVRCLYVLSVLVMVLRPERVCLGCSPRSRRAVAATASDLRAGMGRHSRMLRTQIHNLST